MAASEAEFVELVGHEMTVDVDRLRDVSFFGVPESVRAQVWRVLLPLFDADLSRNKGEENDPQSMETATGEEEGLNKAEIRRIFQTELARFQRRAGQGGGAGELTSKKLQRKLLRILFAFVNSSPGTVWSFHHAGLVQAASPFAILFKNEQEGLQCFRHAMRARESYFGDGVLGNSTLGRFLMLFRSRLPELYTHFEEMEVEPERWAASWLQWLLCRELPYDRCLRLWDSYFAAPDGHGLTLHTFVCLAILENCQNDLEDLEHGEILTFLHHLPYLDMDRIIVQAQYLAHDFKQDIS